MNLPTTSHFVIKRLISTVIFRPMTIAKATTGCFLLSAMSLTATGEEASHIEEVVVTAASRLASGFESPKPVTTVDKTALENRGITNVADYINEIPSFIATDTPATGTINTRNIASNGLNLRSLGTNRTLVLVDRRRYVSTNDQGTVDSNVIPQTLLEQVEIVTGGASAQWGSDAIAGVVNMKLNRDLEGFKLDSRYGESGEGDSQEEFVSFAYGIGTPNGRGHLVFAGEYQNNDGIAAQTDRDWGREAWGLVTNPEDTGPNDGIPAEVVARDVRLGLGTRGGYLPAALGNHPAVAQMQFAPDGSLLPYDSGTFPVPQTLASLPFQIGGDGSSLSGPTALQTPLERKNFMATMDYDLTDRITAFLDISYGRTESKNETVQPWSFIGGGPDVIFADNPFIPAAVQQTMTANAIPVLVMARTNEDHGFITSESINETLRFVGGFNGEVNVFERDWNWDFYVTFGETDTVDYQRDNVIIANRNFAVDAVLDPATNQIVCRANLGGANGAPGCVPLNLFGDGAPSQAALDYIHGTGTTNLTVQQEVYALSIDGELFDLPAGPVAVAFGGEYRDESARSELDTISQNNGFFLGNGTPLGGDFDVKEVFVEVGAPVFDTNNGISLDLNGAVRYADYSTSGSVTTWSIGGRLTPHSDLTVRGSVSRDIRAPNIFELFSAELLSFANLTNPATNMSALSQIRTGGNAGLDVEKSKTYTAGLVFQPSWLEGLSLSADWYQIKIKDVITTLPLQTIINNCFNLNFGCADVTVVGNVITSVNATFTNISQRTVEGVDIEARYTTDELWNGTLDIRWLTSYVNKSITSPDGITSFNDAGVVSLEALGDSGIPHWRWNMTANYNRDKWGTTLQLRYVGGGDLLNDTSIEAIDYSVDDAFYLNLSGRYNFSFADANLQLYAGINNLLDEDPPVAPNRFLANWITNPRLYDLAGRSFYGGIRASF